MGVTMTVGVKKEWATAAIEDQPKGALVIRRRFRPKEWGIALVRQGGELQKYYLAITFGERLKLMPVESLPSPEVKPRRPSQVKEGDPLNAGFVFTTPSFMGIASERIIFGFKPEWATASIVNIPDGAKLVRRRFKPKTAAVAFVKLGNELREYSLGLAQGDDLKLVALSGLNRKESGFSHDQTANRRVAGQMTFEM
jgi:hypothetical protein